MAGIEQLNNFVLISGTITIVILLIVLIIQSKHANKIKQEALEISLRKQFMDLQLTIARNEDLASLYQNGLRGFTGLSDSEQTRFFIVAADAFTHWSEVKRHAESGLVPDNY
ncbi:MAG: hypothetical protein ACI9XC_000547 [Gammaproteobacteria bacterium]